MTRWKHWPYWLKGGVVGGGIAIASAVLTSLCIYATTPPIGSENLGLQCAPLSVPFLLIWLTPFASFLDMQFPILIFNIVAWFIGGSLIGSVVAYFRK